MSDLACTYLGELAGEIEKDAVALSRRSDAPRAARLTQAVQHIREAIALLQPPEESDHE
jgi:small ligand-binding sensory domain FIST